MTGSDGRQFAPGFVGIAGALAITLSLAGCVTPTSRPPSGAAAHEAPRLLGSGTLEIPRDCAPAPGSVYRTLFIIQPDGRVAEAASASGEGCVQVALQRWVTTFEYAATGEPTSTAIDWMLVTASRMR